METNAITNRPLLIDPATLSARLDAKAAAADKQPDILAYFFGERAEPEVVGGVSIIPVHGVVDRAVTGFDKDTGTHDLEDLNQWLDEAEANPEVSAILLDFDTPGGGVTGVAETAARIRSISKPVVAFTSGMCCSAGYWLASSSDAVLATGSSAVGSIGVYMAFADMSKMAENAGVKIEVIKSGDLKGAGIPGTSLSDDQRADLQAQVDAIHAEFKDAVRMRRSLVSEDSMRGQSFSGSEAARRGLVTGLVNNRAEAIARARSL